MSRPDALEVLVLHFACSLLRGGHTPSEARREAELRVDLLVEDLARSGAPVGVFLRRIKVYRLRCQGVGMQVIAGRFNITRMQAYTDYRAELLRRRNWAASA
jgi:hypothetical protein